MKLRAPAVPLITVDPYFSVWSFSDKLYESETVHWTGRSNKLLGIVTVDGVKYRFMGKDDNIPCIKQKALEIDAFSSCYTFENDYIRLEVKFTSPRLADDLYLISSPTSYIHVKAISADGSAHTVSVRIYASEELCLNEKGQYPVVCEKVTADGCADTVRMGSTVQNILNRSGDDLRIDWGYLYLSAVRGQCGITHCDKCTMDLIYADCDISSQSTLFIIAYDDISSINYFGDFITSYWNKDGETILQAIAKAAENYDSISERCLAASNKLSIDAVKAGGEKYAELLTLAYRQVVAAHKLAVDKDGQIIFISKECFSNGCAATVDVSYPSIPMFLIYNPLLVKGMMLPILKFASSDAWPHDFAPHDAGTYPILTGQVYYGTELKGQMPLEECGNMLVMAAAYSLAENNADFALEWDCLLRKWADYLVENGEDPENQLCTDDFAGHLAHNCNLTLKAIMGIASYAVICGMQGKNELKDKYFAAAKDMAESWCKRASNSDGSYRLAFDSEDSFSMKYNAVWDKLMGLNIFPRNVIESEIASNFKHFNPYGMPLDNRETYTKSDWITWTATLTDDYDTFKRYIEPLWTAYNHSKSRVPLGDWYDTVTAEAICFRNRTVQGGLFIKLLDYYGIIKVKKI